MYTNQRWSPRGRGHGLEDPRGQLMVSLALKLQSLALASQSNLTFLGFGLESKILNSHVLLWVTEYDHIMYEINAMALAYLRALLFETERCQQLNVDIVADLYSFW